MSETSIAGHYAMLTDTPVVLSSIETLDSHTEVLRQGRLLPVGTVEFVRKAMQLAGVQEPADFSYPAVLANYLHRTVMLRRAGSVRGTWFIKPTKTKQFTGFVLNTSATRESLDRHDLAQHLAFKQMSPEDLVWVSEPVVWQSEWRYYVIGKDIVGCGRYDDGADDTPEPDMYFVTEMVARMASLPGTPSAYAVDAGVLSTGETALVECTDAWAIGYYKGTLSPADYMQMLWVRWQDILTQ
jgi:hypothetical protein